MKIIIAGGRDFSDYDWLKAEVNITILPKNVEEVVSGACSAQNGIHTFTRKDGTKVYGADGLGERYAEEMGFPVRPFPADWKNFQKSAGYIRNREMAKYADGLIAFWDGRSKGTGHMIQLAKKNNLIIKIVEYEKESVKT